MSKKSKARRNKPHDEAESATGTADPSASASSSWTSDHHLIGTTQIPGSALCLDENQHGYTDASKQLVISNFCPERSLDQRQPALWRGIIAASNSYSNNTDDEQDNNNNNNSKDYAVMAVDRVAKDLQQPASFALLTPPAFAQNQVVQERLQAILYEHVVEDWLPTLVLLAACEEVNHQFLRQQQAQLDAAASQSATATTTSSKRNGKSSQQRSWTVPEYYKRTPNSYLTPPSTTTTTTVAGSSKKQQHQQQNEAAASSIAIHAPPVTFTPSQLVARIKQGCLLLWNHYYSTHYQPTRQELLDLVEREHQNRRSSSRLARSKEESNNNNNADTANSVDPVQLWQVQPGGKIALYLKQQLMDLAESKTEKKREKDTNGKNGQDASAVASTSSDLDATAAEAAAAATEESEPAVADASPMETEVEEETLEDDDDEAGDDEADDDDDFEPKDDTEEEEDDDEDDDIENGMIVKENVKDLELDEPINKAKRHNDAHDDFSDKDDEADGADGDEAYNPYFALTNPAVMEWLGRKTAKLLTTADLQSVFHVLLLTDEIMSSNKKKKGKLQQLFEVGETFDALMSSMDVRIWNKILSSTANADVFHPSSRLVLRLANEHEDDDVTSWETQYFGRTSFSIGVVDEEEGADAAVSQEEIDESVRLEREYKEQKAHDTWRYKGIHGGYTVWPSWNDAAKEWFQSQTFAYTEEPHVAELESGNEENRTNTDASTNTDNDLALAQALAEQAVSQEVGSRRTRRGGESGIFYGYQSGTTTKQLLDAVLRFTSQNGFQTTMGLFAAIPDESADPLRRLRGAVGKLVWKRNQLAMLTVENNLADKVLAETIEKQPLLKLEQEVERGDSLCRYIQKLHETELHLRQLVLKHMSKIPVSIVATAADDRASALECLDDADFEDPSAIEWHAAGHELLHQIIYRPRQLHNTDEQSTCHWYRLKDFSLPVALSPDAVDSSDPVAIGNAKDPTIVERRMRFRAVPVSSPDDGDEFVSSHNDGILLLTDAQARAGMIAAKMARENIITSPTGNIFANGSFTKISLFPTEANGSLPPMNYLVVAHDSVLDENKNVVHKILVMPDEKSNNSEAIWATLEDGTLRCKLAGDSQVYSIQQFDYDSSSAAHQECRNIIKFLERHSKAGPFLEPVDPIALNIPSYRAVVKNPMDISTVSTKLHNGEYSNIPPSKSSYRTPIGRMLNGSFRSDIELVFDNAMLFNPPGDWVHVAAAAVKSAVLKKIEQATENAELRPGSRVRQGSTMYVDEDSDVDMYVYESDQDEEYGSSRRNRKRKRTAESIPKEENSTRVTERSFRLQKIMNDSSGLRGPFADLPVNYDVATFSLPQDWSCFQAVEEEHRIEPLVDQDEEMDNLLALYRQMEEHESAGLRRSTRAQVYDEPRGKSGSKGMAVKFRCNELDLEDSFPSSRFEVELACEKAHESFFAKLYREQHKNLVTGKSNEFGRFADESFPPYLGRLVPLDNNGNMTWEIRSTYVIPALRWVIRGLIHSQHIGEIEALTMDSMSSGMIIANHVYYIDDRQPFDVVGVKELQRRKRAGQGAGDQSEEEIELSEYEKLRAERVARNADRLKALGLA